MPKSIRMTVKNAITFLLWMIFTRLPRAVGSRWAMPPKVLPKSGAS
jgi:hypothetical protein